MNKFEYRIYDSVYKEMISGNKKIEFRLLNDKTNMITIGDEIKFIVVDNDTKNLLVEVTNKYIYDDIEALWNSKEKDNNILEFSKNDFINQFFTIFGKEKVLSSKIVGIEFKIKGVDSND